MRTDPFRALDRRRMMIAGGAAAGSGILPRTHAQTADASSPIVIPLAEQSEQQALAPLRSDGLLPDPDFTRLHPTVPHLVGIRPYRSSGVRLELMDAPVEGSASLKLAIHNYGHGGAGITLSWGCAAATVDLVTRAIERLRPSRSRPTIAVLGTGVIGLTAATEIRRRWPDMPITIYARTLDLTRTTSHVAGGQFEPSFIPWEVYTSSEDKKRELVDWLQRAHTRITGIQNSGLREQFGIAKRKNYTPRTNGGHLDFAAEAGVVSSPLIGRMPFRNITGNGREYDTWLLNPMIMLPKLTADLKSRKVMFVERMFYTPADVAALSESIVVNCTGFGAGHLFGDLDVRAKRGLLVRLERTDPRQFYFVSGCGNSYIFCRQNDIVVGGIAIDDDTTDTLVDADLPLLRRILREAKQVFDGQTNYFPSPPAVSPSGPTTPAAPAPPVASERSSSP